MTTTRKRRISKPVTPVDAPEADTAVVVPPVAPVVKADWVHRILYVAVIALAWHYFTAKQGDTKPASPEPDAPVALHQEWFFDVAPLFPPEQNETASLYAAYFAAQADKVELDQKPIPQPVFVAARKAMKLPDNPQLAAVVMEAMKPYSELPLQGCPPDKLRELVATYRELSDACLQASAD